jgi:hypothetical protein
MRPSRQAGRLLGPRSGAGSAKSSVVPPRARRRGRRRHFFHEVARSWNPDAHRWRCHPRRRNQSAGAGWPGRGEPLRITNGTFIAGVPRSGTAGWLRHRRDYSIRQRNNLWTLFEPPRGGAGRVTVLALGTARRETDPAACRHDPHRDARCGDARTDTRALLGAAVAEK